MSDILNRVCDYSLANKLIIEVSKRLEHIRDTVGFANRSLEDEEFIRDTLARIGWAHPGHQFVKDVTEGLALHPKDFGPELAARDTAAELRLTNARLAVSALIDAYHSNHGLNDRYGRDLAALRNGDVSSKDVLLSMEGSPHHDALTTLLETTYPLFGVADDAHQDYIVAVPGEGYCIAFDES